MTTSQKLGAITLTWMLALAFSVALDEAAMATLSTVMFFTFAFITGLAYENEN